MRWAFNHELAPFLGPAHAGREGAGELVMSSVGQVATALVGAKQGIRAVMGMVGRAFGRGADTGGAPRDSLDEGGGGLGPGIGGGPSDGREQATGWEPAGRGRRLD